MVVHAYSCRQENCWAYVSICGLSWLAAGPFFPSPPPAPPRARVGPEPVPTCRLCLRRLRVHERRLRVAQDVLRPYDVATAGAAPIPRLRVA